MSDFNNLIDFSELIKVIKGLHAQVKYQDQRNNENYGMTEKINKSFSELKKEIEDIKQSSNGFLQGIANINKIEDKMVTWSERFRVLDENNYNFMVKLKNLEENYEDQFENIKIMIEDENKYLKNEFSTEIDKKLQNSSDIFHEKIEEITEILKNFHSELDVEELELQSLKAKTDPGNDPIILTKNEEKPQISVEYKEKPQISSELKEKPEISEEFQEKAYKKSNTLTGFKARLANIENQITFLRQNQENIKKVSEVIEKPEKKKKLPKKEKGVRVLGC